MNPHMTGRAVLESRISHIMVGANWDRFSEAPTPEALHPVVAFEAHSKHHRAAQQPRIRRSVRRMACLAAIHPHSGVLEDKRAPLLGMALQKGLFIRERLLHHG